VAGLANSVWSGLVGLAVVPFYLKYLGVEAYGLIGFFVTTQALLQILDMGLAPTVNREVARYSASGEIKAVAGLVHTLAIIYWAIAAGIAVLLATLSPVIADHWLQSNELGQESVSRAVLLIGLVIASRWPVGLYQGVLIGAQQIVLSSALNITMITTAGVGAVVILAFVSPSIEAFFLWQVGISLVYTGVVRWAAWRIVGGSMKRQFSVAELKRVWRFSAGLSGIAISGLVFTQLDKVVLSKMLDLSDFGHYMLAAVLSGGLYLMITPTFNVLYPRLTSLVASDDKAGLQTLYRLGTRTMIVLLFPLAMLLAAFPESVVEIWTGDPDVANAVSPILSLLVMGTALNGVMFLPYALQLAHGVTWIALAINVSLLFIMIPMVVALVHFFGAIGGAFAWVIIESLYVAVGTALTHRHLLRGQGGRWLFVDVGIPLLVVIAVGFAGRGLKESLRLSVYEQMVLGIGLAAVCATLILIVSPQVRTAMWRFVGVKMSAGAQ